MAEATRDAERTVARFSNKPAFDDFDGLVEGLKYCDAFAAKIGADIVVVAYGGLYQVDSRSVSLLTRISEARTVSIVSYGFAIPEE